ncbi:E3 ubiquitin-protein ligase hel2 [Pelomyxa schiedti]|nr:E3 ubiquitin-protein ligase hel2 [Pelomyxa schiedti]
MPKGAKTTSKANNGSNTARSSNGSGGGGGDGAVARSGSPCSPGVTARNTAKTTNTSASAATRSAATSANATASSAATVAAAKSAKYCIVCCEAEEVWCVGDCDHSELCALCGLRQRFLFGDKSCCLCKVPQETVVFTSKHSTPFSRLIQRSLVYDEFLKIHFDGEHIRRQILDIISAACVTCASPFPLRVLARPATAAHAKTPFPSLAALKQHVKKSHPGLNFCHICLSERKVFIVEQLLFTPPELEKHMREWDGGISQENKKCGKAVVKGHPSCLFCRQHFYNLDHLYEHLNRVHTTCFLCERESVRTQYYENSEQLMKHYSDCHYLCLHPECVQNASVTVFLTPMELHTHQALEHSAGKRKSAPLLLGYKIKRMDRSGSGLAAESNTEKSETSTTTTSSTEISETKPAVAYQRTEVGLATFMTPMPTSTSYVGAALAASNSFPGGISQEPTKSKGKKKGKKRSQASSLEPGEGDSDPYPLPPMRLPPLPPPSTVTEAPIALNTGLQPTSQEQRPTACADSPKVSVAKPLVEPPKQSVLEEIKSTLGPEKFQEFRNLSADFIASRIDAYDYYTYFFQFFGKTPSSNSLFLRFVDMVPNKDKLNELTSLHQAIISSGQTAQPQQQQGNPPPPPLAPSPSQSHSHTLPLSSADEFPSLSESFTRSSTPSRWFQTRSSAFDPTYIHNDTSSQF